MGRIDLGRGLIRGAWSLAVAAMAMASVGCGDDADDAGDAGDGDDAEAPLDRLFAGPCTATRHAEGGPTDIDCVMHYDDADRLIAIECTSPDGSTQSELTWAFSGDELTGATSTYEFLAQPGTGVDDYSEEQNWTLGETITDNSVIDSGSSDSHSVVAETYEREGFQFVGHPFDPERALDAPDSLIHVSLTQTLSSGEVVTGETDYTYDGPPCEGTRTRTGPDGRIVVFSYDDVGRLLQSMSPETDDRAGGVVTYGYDGDHLESIDYDVTIEGGTDSTHVTFEHDTLGNVITKRYFPYDTPIQITEFGYDCW